MDFILGGLFRLVRGGWRQLEELMEVPVRNTRYQILILPTLYYPEEKTKNYLSKTGFG